MTVLDDARALLATGPLCDACLGRPFADRSFGLRNEERGRGLRTTLALADDEPFEARSAPESERRSREPDESTGPDECWVCEGVCGRFDDLAGRVVDALDGLEFRTYQVGTRVPPLVEENERLLREEAGMATDAGEPLKSEVNREVGRRVGAELDREVDFERPDVQVLLDLDEDAVEVQVNSVAVYGRYRKLERGIPQTHWPEQYDTSVEELVAPPLLSALRGTEAVFHGAGREDVDALMLGTGRPFVLEIKEPRRRSADLDELAAEVAEHSGGRVEVTDLQFATHEMVERVKELDASKTYRAQVAFDEPVDEADFRAAIERLDGATVEQRTPHRVDHRRADLVRERTVYAASGELLDATSAEVEVHGEGGLYVKELVSGDEGRTEPSLAGLLGVGATVTALDVVRVEGEDEPFATAAFLRDVEDEE